MKVRILAVVLAVAPALVPELALAQAAPPSMPRGEAGGTVGWLSGNKDGIDGRDSNDWYNQGLYGSVLAGWYWTEHHKTQVEFGVTNSIDFWAARTVTIDNVQGWGSSSYTIELRRAAVGQYYQFFRNQWVHPHVGVGADLTWERVTERAEPIFVYNPVARQTVQVVPGGTFGPSTKLRVRPYAETGFKAYMTPHAFFRGDMRVLVGGGIDEVLFRCGFGIDF